MASGLRLYTLNHSYFKTWSSDMAYILGFTCADGCVYHRTLSWELSNKFSSDKELLEQISKKLGSTYEVERRPKSFRLRINSSLIVRNLKDFGIIPNKTKILKFPDIPRPFLRDFIRGFLDGDGWVLASNKGGSLEIVIGFCNGSYDFMKGLVDVLRKNIKISNFNLRKRIKKRSSGYDSVFYQLEFYSDNAFRLIKFLYDNLDDLGLYLRRKFESQEVARKFHKTNLKIRKFSKKFVKIEGLSNMDFTTEINRLLNDGLIPQDLSRKFGVSLSTIYRWMHKAGVQKISKRCSPEWAKRILTSRSKKRYAK
ncbi:hypothetical protein COU61_03160 [Candidatus Pacearchaeota archaeon CG10_big_fil_rev_8_21_14_0_10_35_13]|nr:MAG: hypothetical protein COU61_03160 [Candidatus Pacearchaeota archaeon CG10_big_fil_rev_8_21_14_0_10_35_13]